MKFALSLMALGFGLQTAAMSEQIQKVEPVSADTLAAPADSSAKSPSVDSSAALRDTSAPAPKVSSQPAPGKAMASAHDTVAAAMSAAADSSQSAVLSADSAKAARAALKDPIPLENARLSHFRLNGVVRGTAYARDLSAHADIDKASSFGLDLARLSFAGDFGDGFGFAADLDLAKGQNGLGVGQLSLQWRKGPFDKIHAGRIKRAFSHEALLGDAQLPFNYRGRLYNAFLQKTTGYTGYDLGIGFLSGFEDGDIPVRYELAIYNGRHSEDPAVGYSRDAWADGDLQAKDVAFRLEVEPTSRITVEAALSTKAAEDKSDPENFNLAMNTAYELGVFYQDGGVQVNGEIAYGDNHQGVDARIVDGSSDFLAFYLEGILRHDYPAGHWSEALFKLEGLDPDMGFKRNAGKKNDGKLRYTLGVTYGMTAYNSLTLAWGVLHPISESRSTSDTRLRHDLDCFWKMVF